MGAFSVDEKDIDQAHLHAQVQIGHGVEIPVDYGHATLYDREAPAAGWVKTTDKRQVNGQPALFAQIAWTDRAAAAIRAGEYKYLSPTIQFHSVDRVSQADVGTSLHSLALTNKPFLHELPSVRLNSIMAALSRLQEDPVNDEQRKAMAKALGMADTATAEEITARVAVLAATEQQTTGLFAALGASKPDEAARAVMALKIEASKTTDTKALTDELASLKAEKTLAEANAEVIAAQRGGKVLGGKFGPDGKPTSASTPNFKAAAEFAARDLGGFRAYLGTQPAIAPLSGPRVGASAAGNVAVPLMGPDGKPIDSIVAERMSRIHMSDDQREINRLMGIPDEQLAFIEAKHNLTAVPKED